MAHTDVSFESVVAELGIARSASFNPVFQAMFAFQNLEFPVVELAGLEISPLGGTGRGQGRSAADAAAGRCRCDRSRRPDAW